jgi:hypothetical protein
MGERATSIRRDGPIVIEAAFLAFSQPIFKFGELGRSWLNQRAGCKSAYPVVRDSYRLSYLAVLPNRLLNRFPGLFDAFLNNHVLTL